MIPSGLYAADPGIVFIRDVKAAVRPDRDANGAIELRLGGRSAVAEPVAGWPPPATVVMIPSGLTRRTRELLVSEM